MLTRTDPVVARSLTSANENDAVVMYSSIGATYEVVMERCRKYLTLWWRGMFMQWIMRPREFIAEEIAQFQSEHGWKPRRTGAWRELRRCPFDIPL